MNPTKKSLVYISLLIASLAHNPLFALDNTPPKLTIIFTIDQLSYRFLQKIKPCLKGGIKRLLDEGVNYTNAYWPYALPETGPAHVGINTGTFPDYHGIPSNTWRNTKFKIMPADIDTPQEAAVFAPDGLYPYGKSAKNIMVDGISDQLVLESTENCPIEVWSLSYKSRSAIGNAGKLGKAIWYDNKTGHFTSSKAYFNDLPEWIQKFNAKNIVDSYITKPCYYFYKKNSCAYGCLDYVPDRSATRIKNPYIQFTKTPAANKTLLCLAKECIKETLTHNKGQRIIIWISFSALDLLSHFTSTNCKQTVDMIYHLDYDLKKFCRCIERHVRRPKILYVLTADHGSTLNPKELRKKGIEKTGIIYNPELIKNLKELINQKHSTNLQIAVNPNSIYLGPQFKGFNKEKQQMILTTIKQYLLLIPGIKNAWTAQELKNRTFNKDQIEYFYQRQLFPDRTGDIIFQTFPFYSATLFRNGASHTTPYEDNTHVPLIIYQKCYFEHKKVNDRVWMLQVPNSIAQIHNVPKPSASTFEILPGLFPRVDRYF